MRGAGTQQAATQQAAVTQPAVKQQAANLATVKVIGLTGKVLVYFTAKSQGER